MYHSGNPQPSARQGCRPLSETIHSEHILKERSDAQNVVSRFPCGDTTRRRQAATTFGPEACQPSHRRCVQERSRIRGSRAAANHQNANQALWHRKVNPNAGIHLFPTFFGLLSGLAETFGGIFILLGLFYRPMALFLVGNLMMAASIELAPRRAAPAGLAPL